MTYLHAAICAVLILLPWAALVAPIMHYAFVGWHIKRQDIMDGLGASARLQYFKMFTRGSDNTTEADAFKKFEQLYSDSYGRRFFVCPGIILTLCAFTAVSLVVFTALQTQSFIINPLFDLPVPAIAALSGAYMWVFNDFVSRSRRLDFSPSDIHWASLRIIIAVPLGYAFAALAAPALAPFIAFALGAFPLTELISLLRRIASKRVGLNTASEDSSDSVIKLQGINRTIVERLNNEDISTVTQIAYCDPIRLTMRSNLTFNFVIDCMNQALAWMYFENKLDDIRPLGMRGAVEIKYLFDDLEGSDLHDPENDKAKSRAKATLAAIAKVLQQDAAALETTLWQIAEDPYTEFLYTVWDKVGPPDEPED